MFGLTKTRRDPKLDWVASLAPFTDLDDLDLSKVSEAVYRTSRPIGARLTRQASYGHEAFVIASGSVDIVKDGELISVLKTGDVLGEIAMIGEPHRTATTLARSDVELAVFDRNAFLHLLGEVPTFGSLVHHVAADRQN